MLLLLLLLLSCWALLVSGQGQPPPSPCPDVFSYVFDRGQWSGRVVVPVPAAAKRMVVVASLLVVDVELPPEHPGELRLMHNMPTVVQQVQSREAKAVDYVVEFPTQSPLPLVDKIKVNRNVICQGPPARARVRTKVTFTHRLNGLLPPSTRPSQQHNLKPGHNLDMVDEERQMPPKNGGLELLDNEVVKVEAQEAELMSNPNDPDQGSNVGPDGSSEDEVKLHPDDDAELLDNEIPVANNPVPNTPKPSDREDIPENEFDLDDIDDDVELLDNEIPDANDPEVKFKPKYPNGVKDREEIPENEFEFGDDVEMLDNEIPHANDPEVKFKPKYPNGVKDREEIPENEFEFGDDVEMLENEIPDANDPEVKFKPKHPNGVKDREEIPENEFEFGDDVELLENGIPVGQNKPKHKVQGNNHDRDREDLPESEFELDDGGLELMDNEILEADSSEMQNLPKHKSKGFNFNTGFVTKKGQKENPKNKYDSDDIELFDNEVLQADSIELLNTPNYKSQGSNFKLGFHIPMNEADLTEKANRYGSVELLDDDNMGLDSVLEYDDNFSDNELA